ncbi:MAG TPA: type 1 glutamine amidotransferase domain-containing protein [Sedimentisphaerales bacterium]|nr:type 1 glutamine amidotransferase domain-containing protein [Sedimentisphaerales bacterium]
MSVRKVAVMVDEMYQVLEVWYPYYRLKEAGFDVNLVAAEADKQYHSKEGYPCVSDRAAGRVDAAEYDCMVVPGGFAPDFMRRSKNVIKFANDMVNAGKVIAAICHGGWLLCSTTAYKGKKATCFMAIKDDIINAGAEYIDAECVVDGNLITSRKPDDLPAFCRAIIDALNELE